GQGKKQISFASPYPGKILTIDLSEIQGKFICQKDAFLCAAKGVSIGIEFSRKLGRGLFGGEGFIMQKLEGDGLAFVHAGGTLAKKVLAVGEVLKVDTGCIVGFTQTVDYDIEFVGGIKNTIFGGEGLFFATLRGPGTVYIQSLPFSRLAGRVLASIPRGGKDKGEGSVLGGLGDLLGGDNRF
ncbi:MAG TPA: AIM24 family protein, partial [Pricia sp.]|nr:AIM24 family protein [Pricia sp.]